MVDSLSVGALLEVRDVTICYGSLTAVSSVSFSLNSGEVAGLTGPSGAGKSTLAAAILRVLPPQARLSGSILCHGRPPAPVFQEPAGALHPTLPVCRQVEEVIRARLAPPTSRIRPRAEQALADAGLATGLFDAFPHQLSGGQRQRVLIAQAIAADPELIIADEPLSSLDAATQQDLLARFRALNQRGVAFLIITHRPPMLAGLATRMLRIDAGRLVSDAF